MNQNISTPKEAAAVVLLEHDSETKICWARRSASLKFLPNYQAFAGGKVETSDAETRVENCGDDTEKRILIACAARETFEEIGVLLVRNAEKMTRGQRASLHDDLISGRMLFWEILAHWNLWIDANDFTFVGRWTTPPFSPMRFRTVFYLAVCPPKQTPYAAIGELEDVEFIEASEALARWRRSEVLCTPPTLNAIRVFSDAKKSVREKVAELLEIATAQGAQPRRIELNSRIVMFPLKTETLPPATHTNCFIVGGKRFIVIDAAAKDESEQAALNKFIGEKINRGDVCQAIIITHQHRDHTGGETALREFLREEFNLEIPIAAHELTAESLTGKIKIQKYIEDDEAFDLQNENGEHFDLKTLHTPGHARGLLAFYDEELGFLLSGDNVISLGSVVIAPPEGNMKNYLQSLERLKNLPNLRFLCGSHGAAVFGAKGKIEEYIAHRLEREKQILAAVEKGAKTPREIVEKVYTDVSPALYELAEKSVEAHLEKLREDGEISRE
ncbi:MAG: MBL fold metallo-hydrolase [Pyrinomonadaceae bacterium]